MSDSEEEQGFGDLGLAGNGVSSARSPLGENVISKANENESQRRETAPEMDDTDEEEEEEFCDDDDDEFVFTRRMAGDEAEQRNDLRKLYGTLRRKQLVADPVSQLGDDNTTVTSNQRLLGQEFSSNVERAVVRTDVPVIVSDFNGNRSKEYDAWKRRNDARHRAGYFAVQ